MSDPLDPRALLALLPHLLPPSSSSPLPRPADSIAALVHAIHVALGFRREPSETVPIAGQPGDTQAQSGPSSDTATTPTATATAGPSGDAMDTDTDVGDDAASETTTAVDPADDPNPAAHVDVAHGRLPQGWNARGEDAYVFAYAHPQSSMRFRVRVGRMGARVQIDAMADVSTGTERLRFWHVLRVWRVLELARGGESALEWLFPKTSSLEEVDGLRIGYGRRGHGTVAEH